MFHSSFASSAVRSGRFLCLLISVRRLSTGSERDCADFTASTSSAAICIGESGPASALRTSRAKSSPVSWYRRANSSAGNMPSSTRRPSSFLNRASSTPATLCGANSPWLVECAFSCAISSTAVKGESIRGRTTSTVLVPLVYCAFTLAGSMEPSIGSVLASSWTRTFMSGRSEYIARAIPVSSSLS